MERPATFTRHVRDDLTQYVTVDYWPDRMDISRTMVGRLNGGDHITHDGDEITIKVSNGEATYRIEGYELLRDVYCTVAMRRQWIRGQA